MSLVLDPSLALSWYFEDERVCRAADALLDQVADEVRRPVVPALSRQLRSLNALPSRHPAQARRRGVPATMALSLPELTAHADHRGLQTPTPTRGRRHLRLCRPLPTH